MRLAWLSKARRIISHQINKVPPPIRQRTVRYLRFAHSRLLWTWKLRFARPCAATVLVVLLGYVGMSFMPDIASVAPQAGQIFTPPKIVQLAQVSPWGRYQPSTDSYPVSLGTSVLWSASTPPQPNWSGTNGVKITTNAPSYEGVGALSQYATVNFPAGRDSTVSVTISTWQGNSTFSLMLSTPARSTKPAPLVQLAVQKALTRGGCVFQTAASSADTSLMFNWHSDPPLAYQTGQDPEWVADLSSDGINPPQIAVQWRLMSGSRVMVQADAADLTDHLRALGTSGAIVLQCL